MTLNTAQNTARNSFSKDGSIVRNTNQTKVELFQGVFSTKGSADVPYETARAKKKQFKW